MKLAMGIDLGGTAIKAGIYTADGNLVKSTSRPTPRPATPEAVLITLVDLIQHLDPTGEVPSIGIGVPGITDRAGRIVKTAINLDHWHHIPLAEQIEQLTNRSAVLANDANCAGLGEVWLGAARGFADVLMLTLGTGVGGAIILDGQLLVGQGGAAAELGHIGLNMQGPACNCGSRGCLEQYVAAPAIERLTGYTPKVLGELAAEGNLEALGAWSQIGSYLGVGLASLAYVFAPQAIVIGGGVSASSAYFLPSALAELEERVLLPCREGLQVVVAQHGNDAGMEGAARLAFQKA